jgi:hypothetical protein
LGTLGGAQGNVVPMRGEQNFLIPASFCPTMTGRHKKASSAYSLPFKFQQPKGCTLGAMASSAHLKVSHGSFYRLAPLLLAYETHAIRAGFRLIPSPHLLVLATSERRVPTLVATNGSHWLK